MYTWIFNKNLNCGSVIGNLHLKGHWAYCWHGRKINQTKPADSQMMPLLYTADIKLIAARQSVDFQSHAVHILTIPAVKKHVDGIGLSSFYQLWQLRSIHYHWRLMLHIRWDMPLFAVKLTVATPYLSASMMVSSKVAVCSARCSPFGDQCLNEHIAPTVCDRLY